MIPTRDRWPLCLVGVEQAIAQQNVDLEVVVVDDGSRPELAPALAGLADKRVRVVRNDASIGAAGARNRGIEAARGGWVAFLDDDDLWAPHKLRAQLDAAHRAQAGWCYAAAITFDRRAGVVGKRHEGPSPAQVSTEVRRPDAIPFGSSNVVVKSELVRRLGGFDTEFEQLADWDLWIRLANVAPAASCNQVLLAYALHARNMVVQDPEGALRELELLRLKHSSRLVLDELAIYRWIAYGQRRAGHRVRAARTYLRGAMRLSRPSEVARAAGALIGERGMGQARAQDGFRPAPAWLTASDRLPHSAGNLITIVIPVWGDYVGRYLGEAIDSIRGQDMPVTIVVIDNASETRVAVPDGIKVSRLPSRVTIGEARNAGLALVETPWVIFWDADDIMLPGALRALLNRGLSDPEAVVVTGRILEALPGRRHHWPRSSTSRLAYVSPLFAALHCISSLFPTTGVLIRADAARDAAGFADTDTGDDWIFGASLAFRGRVSFIRHCTRLYRAHDTSVSFAWRSRPHIVTIARDVRQRLRSDTGVPSWVRKSIPMIAALQYGVIFGVRPPARFLRRLRRRGPYG